MGDFTSLWILTEEKTTAAYMLVKCQMKSQIIRTDSAGFQHPQDVLQSPKPPDLLPIKLKVSQYFCPTSNPFNKLLLGEIDRFCGIMLYLPLKFPVTNTLRQKGKKVNLQKLKPENIGLRGEEGWSSDQWAAS